MSDHGQNHDQDVAHQPASGQAKPTWLARARIWLKDLEKTLKQLKRTTKALAGAVAAFSVVVVGVWLLRDNIFEGGGEDAGAGTATNSAEARPAVDVPKNDEDRAPDRQEEQAFLVGGYYELAPGDSVLTQVVDRLAAPALGSACPFEQSPNRPHQDPGAQWIDREGNPVLNPCRPLGPEVWEVVAAFGSAENVVEYVKATLEPI